MINLKDYSYYLSTAVLKVNHEISWLKRAVFYLITCSYLKKTHKQLLNKHLNLWHKVGLYKNNSPIETN